MQPADHDLPPADREYYVVQSEYYHEAPERDDSGRMSKVVESSYNKGLSEQADLVVFNGRQDALTKTPLKGTVGETVRIYFANAGPNYTSSFHVIGSIFKNVWRDGSIVDPPSHNISTLSVPPGGAAIVDMYMHVPGEYTLVDHAIFRTDKGAIGLLNVSGDANHDVYTSDQPQYRCSGCKTHT